MTFLRLIEFIQEYYHRRNLIMPDVFEASAFLTTEHAEVLELLFQRQHKFVRNNPLCKLPYSKQRMAEELGDVIMMTTVIAILVGVDPFTALIEKLTRKMEELGV